MPTIMATITGIRLYGRDGPAVVTGLPDRAAHDKWLLAATLDTGEYIYLGLSKGETRAELDAKFGAYVGMDLAVARGTWAASTSGRADPTFGSRPHTHDYVLKALTTRGGVQWARIRDASPAEPYTLIAGKDLDGMAAAKTAGTVGADIWSLAEAVIGVSQRVLLAGPPGTGKSYTAARAGVKKTQEVYITTMTEEMPSAELRGHYIPNEKGGFSWHDGPAISAWRHGGRLVINEVDRAGGDSLSFLLAVLDDPATAHMTLPSGEQIKPHANFSCVATMNGDPTNDLPPALRDRFPVTLDIQEVHPKAISDLPADLQQVAKETALLKEEERRVSVRVWLEFARLRTSLDEKVAARAVFGARAAEALKALTLARAK